MTLSFTIAALKMAAKQGLKIIYKKWSLWTKPETSVFV